MDLTKQIHDYEVRISELRSRQTSQPKPGGLFDELYEEVSQGIEELRIVDEELRQRNTELYEAYSALLQERQRYHELFAFAPDAYLVTDLGGVPAGLVPVHRREADHAQPDAPLHDAAVQRQPGGQRLGVEHQLRVDGQVLVALRADQAGGNVGEDLADVAEHQPGGREGEPARGGGAGWCRRDASRWWSGHGPSGWQGPRRRRWTRRPCRQQGQRGRPGSTTAAGGPGCGSGDGSGRRSRASRRM